MRLIFKVFIKDIKTIFRNRAAFLLILGYCFLPSLYAWINIQACWDPYANTGNLPVAVINNDEGAVLNGKNINVGDNIVAELKKNKSIGWVITDSWQGNYGLNEGKYYAVIEIPADFTKGLTSLATVAPKKPQITYRVNEKLNAIATKITNVATDKLAQNVKSSFINSVNKQVLQQFNQIGTSVVKNKAQILQLKDTMNEAYNDLENTKKFITEANASSEGLQKYLQSTKDTLPKLTEQINSLQSASKAGKDMNLDAKQSINTAATALNNDVIEMQGVNDQIQKLLVKLKEINNGTNNENITSTISDTINLCDSLNKTIDSDILNLEAINKSISSTALTNQINYLKTLKAKTEMEEDKSKQLKTMISNNSTKDDINAYLDAISALCNEISKDEVNLSNNLYSNVLPVINNVSDNITKNLDDIDSLLEATKVIVPQLNALANYGIASSKTSINEANKLSDRLTTIQSELAVIIDKMKDLNEKNIDQVIKILNMNPDQIASFLASPIDINETEVNKSEVFGVGITPFYTVLAIWVGVLLLTSILSVECKVKYDIDDLSIVQQHFGKMLLFLVLSLIQATIVTLGDRFLLGVKPENMTVMMLFALMSSVTFTLLIFTLVSIFGNVGKAIAVVVMVFQIAGSGGIYPIQTNPRIFGVLEPLWPFTYAINGFREAIAGPSLVNVEKNMLALFCFSLVFLSLVILKEPFHKITQYLEHKFEKSGL